ncbi:MAG: cell wall-binding repeat-containing protein [Actinomycetes bacterium]
MLRQHLRRVCVLAGAAVMLSAPVAFPAAANAANTAPTVTTPTFTNGLVAYACAGHGGAAGGDGWVTVHADGTDPSFVPWRSGPFSSGVQWSVDGSEMVHVAAMSAAGSPTVAVSEADGSYPWQDTNFADAGGWTDSDATFNGDGTQILFTRSVGGSSLVEAVASAGSDPPVPVAQPDGANSEPTASVTGDIAYVNVATSGPQAGQPYIWILAGGTTDPVLLGPGTLPRFSPDGSQIAFLAATGNRIRTMALDGTHNVATGPVLTDPVDDFRWSPDATKYVIASGGLVLIAPVAAGSTTTTFGGSECTQGMSEVGWQPVPATLKDKVVRVYGQTREETAIAISQVSFPDPSQAQAVVLADSQQFPDGLSAAPLAAKVHGPLLLTPGTATTPLPAVTAEITRLIGSSGTVYIVGGTGSVSQGIQNVLSAHYTVHRIGGIDRYGTSLAVAKELGQGADAPRQLLLATGTDYPDGLSAGAAAASYWQGTGPQGGAVLLTNGATLTADVRAYIQADIAAHPDPAAKVTVTTVGGLADKAYPVAGRLSCAGADRYATSACVARMHFGAQPFVTVAAGTDFPDSLAGGVLAGAVNAPLILVPKPLTTTSAVPYWLHVTSAAVHVGYAFGGPGALGGPVNQLRAIIGIGTGFSTVTPS